MKSKIFQWAIYNPFKELTGYQIGIVVILGTTIAIVVVIIIVALVSLLPIADAEKCKVLFGLGVASWLYGVWWLRRKIAR